MTNTKPKQKNTGSAKAATPSASVFEMIPLSKLMLSPKNVRKTPATAQADAELRASIQATGLKQNLLVHKVGAKFHVHAGGRRLAALQHLKENGHLKASHPIPCQIEDPDQAEDTSAAENMIRSAMHAADQFEAFAALRKKGRTEDQIAAQFGITTDLVRRRLKLASVSPDLMEAFRQGEMSLECVMAFTLTDDHARQVEIWESIKDGYHIQPYTIRNRLTEKSYSGASKLAKFVGIDAYKAAGGTVIEDLFSDRENTHLKDSDLLEKLAQEKLQGLADQAAKTWKWADAELETDYDSFRPFGRVYPQPLDPDPKLEAELEKLQARKDQLEAEYDEETWTEELQEEEDQIWDRMREIEDIQEANVAFTDKDHKVAGCVVTISHAGEVTYHEGLVRPEDIPDEVGETVGKKGADENGGEIEDEGPSIELPQSMRQSSVPVDATTAARKAQGIPQALADDLRATRHQILQAHLAADYATAYDVMLYSMARNAIGHNGYKSPLDQSLRPAMTMGSQERLQDTVASKMLETLEGSLNMDWANADAPEDFQLLCQLPDEDKQAIFAWCTAYALNQQLSNDQNTNAVIEAIGLRLSVDVAACWRPDAVSYWGRVKKDHALDTAKALIGDGWSDERSGFRKADLAKSMEQVFSENPVETGGVSSDIAATTSRWLPDGMSFASDVFPEDANSGTSEREDGQNLPKYLQDAA
ncbi:ParB/RepB/Spo0J family partition protein [Labrenzia sp. DG1229]|uniref:ParB/RepB/Spo0J family partition protein n=1 Tax=Labrenzia sp. DG1229 TaxID=681847 RepID=UPI00048C208E|nr:ParB/RepB/Spo0J family partition protein [Labrenzia sp. DG1229]